MPLESWAALVRNSPIYSLYFMVVEKCSVQQMQQTPSTSLPPTSTDACYTQVPVSTNSSLQNPCTNTSSVTDNFSQKPPAVQVSKIIDDSSLNPSLISVTTPRSILPIRIASLRIHLLVMCKGDHLLLNLVWVDTRTFVGSF